MASNRGYTTATKVRNALANQVNGVFTDAMIDNAINRIEGIIDTRFGLRGTGANSFTWDTTKAEHWVVEGAATYGAALQLAGPSAVSWNTLDQLINAQNTYAYLYKLFMDMIEEDLFSDRVVES